MSHTINIDIGQVRKEEDAFVKGRGEEGLPELPEEGDTHIARQRQGPHQNSIPEVVNLVKRKDIWEHEIGHTKAF